MPAGRQQQITQILVEMAEGNDSAAERLLPHVYDELRALAGSFFQLQRANHTLQPTALVHEAYLKLVAWPDAEFSGRKHFFDVAAMAMRQLLTDHARRVATAKRGGEALRLTLDDSTLPDSDKMEVDLVALDDALARLTELDARQGRIVELRFLAGLNVEDVAAILDISPRTVKLDWQMAKAWLRRELSEA